MYDCYDGKPVTQLFKSRHFTAPSFAERERIIEIFRSEPILFRRLPLKRMQSYRGIIIAATTTGNENKTPSDDAVKKKIATRRALAEHFSASRVVIETCSCIIKVVLKLIFFHFSAPHQAEKLEWGEYI